MWGLQCGAGWARLYEPLLQRIITEGGEIRQVKEKYGRLVIHASGISPELHAALDAATEESMRVCEECGAPGRLRREGGWLKTRCDRHTM